MPDCARARDAKVMAATATQIHASLERFIGIAATLSHIVPQLHCDCLNDRWEPRGLKQLQALKVNRP